MENNYNRILKKKVTESEKITTENIFLKNDFFMYLDLNYVLTKNENYHRLFFKLI